MFNLGSRFGEYAVTGGFFVCVQLLVFTWWYPNVASDAILTFSNVLGSGGVKEIQNIDRSFIDNLITAISLLSIFIVGMLLDISGSTFALHEMRILRYYMEPNKEWLKKLFDTEFPERINDYSDFMGLSPAFPISVKFESTRKVFQPVAPYRLLSVYQRIEQELLSYALESLSEAKLNWLGDQLGLCRMSRAVSNTMYLVGIEMIIYLCVNLKSIINPGNIVPLIPSTLGILLPIFFASFVAYRVYSTFCITLLVIARRQFQLGHEKQV